MRAAAPRRIVLVGAGHAHVIVLKSFGMKPEPGVMLTLVTREVDAPYSGMLPGFVAGHYTYSQCHIDARRLAGWAGAEFVQGTVIGIDRTARRIHVEGGTSLSYDIASVDVGITPLFDGIQGAAAHGVAVKPVSTFAARWQVLEQAALSQGGPRRIVVVGGGAAGFELVLAMRHKLLTAAPAAGIDADAYSFTLVAGSSLLATHNACARALARSEITRQGVTLIENDPATRIEPDAVLLESGRTVPADAALLSTQAGPAEWFATSGLPLDSAGFIAVRPTLQLLEDDDVFAVGDCASVLEHPREKAGVFAVRQGPPLAENLRLTAGGRAARSFTPQRTFLTLLSTGRKHAIASRNGLAFSGSLLWRWKDWIDRGFMSQFDVPAIPGGQPLQTGEMTR
jgi:selenide, water dikinase